MREKLEEEIECELIKTLQSLGFSYLGKISEEELEKNFKQKFEYLNKQALQNKALSEVEFTRLLSDIKDQTPHQSAKILRDKFVLRRDDDTKVYCKFYDENVEKNSFEVINQLVVHNFTEKRYDVNILLNGLPLIQIELKKTGVAITKAYTQMKNYFESSHHRLLRFIQFFVLSNETNTRYFATANKSSRLSFEQSFTWSDEQNRKINNLYDFANAFLNKANLLAMINDFMVVSKQENEAGFIYIMRPYQVHAVKALLAQVKTGENGYIWHTTGSGKTLTSFKAAQLLRRKKDIKKVIFVVDRLDLDLQTLNEFNKFEDACVDASDSTKVLIKQLKDPNTRLVLTTIQKLSRACDADDLAELKEAKIILIFDECHRSTFGSKQLPRIQKTFANSLIYGFTGTPIFPQNSTDGRISADLFGKCIHKYLIHTAINDANVLPFQVEYYSTFKDATNPADTTMVERIDTHGAYNNPKRFEAVVKEIAKIHDKKTDDRQYNALFAVDGIQALIAYYKIFKKLNETLKKPLKIAAIYSLSDERGDGEALEDGKFYDANTELAKIMADFNESFGTNCKEVASFNTALQKKIKANELDIVLVVNIFLTGFDSKKLACLYVDKYLRYHSLIQAFSRTNRLERSKKKFGCIVCFRAELKAATDDAICLFSQSEQGSQEVLVADFKGSLATLIECIKELKALVPTPKAVDELKGERAKKSFIIAFKNALKALKIVQTCKEFDFDKDLLGLIDKREFKHYESKYKDLYAVVKEREEGGADPEPIIDELDFEMSLFSKDTIDYDYIMALLAATPPGEKEREIHTQRLLRELDACPQESKLYKKIDLIKSFISSTLPHLPYDANIMLNYTAFEEGAKAKEIKDFSDALGKDAAFEEAINKEVKRLQEYGRLDTSCLKPFFEKDSFLVKTKAQKQTQDFIMLLAEKYD